MSEMDLKYSPNSMERGVANAAATVNCCHSPPCVNGSIMTVYRPPAAAAATETSA